MTLSSSTSRQQRKSMLPKPRPSSRIITGSGSRRIASNETTGVTSRIARRVPSPLAAVAASCNDNGPNLITQARGGDVPHTHPIVAADYNLLQLPASEFGSRRAGAGAGPPAARRIPWSAGLTSSLYPTPEQSEASSTPSPEAKKNWVDVNVQYRTLPPTTSAEIKHERFFKGQEGQGQGRTITIPAQQHQDTAENYDPAAVATSLLARHAHAHPPRRRPASASTALTLSLTNNGFSRVLDNSPSTGGGDVDGTMPALAWKKSAITRGVVSGKENRRPTRMHARIPPPPITYAVPTIPPRSVRRTVVVAQPPSRTISSSFRETSRPLVIRKQPPSHSLAAAAGSSHVRSASGASGMLPVVGPVPAGIQMLIGDIDHFAKEWTEMFDDLSKSPEDGRLSKLDAFIRIRPTGRPEDAGRLQVDNPVAGKGLPSTNGETVQFDVTRASLARRQHRDKAMVKDAPEKDKPERDLPEAVSASTTDPPRDGAHHLQRAASRNASLPLTPQASRHLPSLPEINQPPIISGSHLVEMTSAVLSYRKDELSNLPESPLTVPRGVDSARRDGVTWKARYYPSGNPSSSTPSNAASLSPVLGPYSSSPWVNLRAPEFVAHRTMINAASDAVPARATSLRGLRAIFKRTSAGLTGAHRQRAESLKERISEPRILSLGSVSISNLRDAGLTSEHAQQRGWEDTTTMIAEDLA